MKRVAIMTWYSYDNYGSVLQATALQRVIEKSGYETSIIAYEPEGHSLKPVKSLSIGFITGKMRDKIVRLLRKDYPITHHVSAFQKFREKHLTLTKPMQLSSELYRLNDEYDAFVCGSDQIWSPLCFNPKYFLDFVQEDEKKVAYAPSMGPGRVDFSYISSQMTNLITHISHLSVREEGGKSLIQDLTGRNASVLLDPTLLLTGEEWGCYESNDDDYGKPYVLCYFLGGNKANIRHAYKIAAQLAMSVKYLPLNASDARKPGAVNRSVGPGEFLGLLRNAAFVCTDSLHGTLFSMLFHRPFLTYLRFRENDKSSQNARIHNLLALTGMRDRLFLGNRTYSRDWLLNIDYAFCDSELDSRRNDSVTYLRDALQQAVTHKSDTFGLITATCCGCGACKASCPQKAITISSQSGFDRAEIRMDECIKCGLCVKVCPMNGSFGQRIRADKDRLFMVKSTDSEVLNVSSSGGVGYHLSKYMYEKGYAVCGCTYMPEHKKAMHILLHPGGDSKELKAFQGSKYIHSDTEQAMEAMLRYPGKIIFFGTPCQVSAVRNLFLNDPERVFLVDIICHGVPTDLLFTRYLDEVISAHHMQNNPDVMFRKSNWDGITNIYQSQMV